MQFNVPQFIEVEDKIIGPLTLKQFIFFAIGGGLLFLIWFVVEFWAFIILAIPLLTIAFIFAFYKVNGRPFAVFLSAVITFLTRPRLYIWRKK